VTTCSGSQIILLELDALEAGRNPESITNGAGLSLGMGNLK